MRSNKIKSLLSKSGLAASVLLLASAAAFGQQQVNLTAGPANVTLPDGRKLFGGFQTTPGAPAK